MGAMSGARFYMSAGLILNRGNRTNRGYIYGEKDIFILEASKVIELLVDVFAME